jgi:hypothetical protein
MSPSEKSLAVVKDIVNIIESIQVQGKDAGRVTNCLGYLSCIQAQLEKEVAAEKPEAPLDQATA